MLTEVLTHLQFAVILFMPLLDQVSFLPTEIGNSDKCLSAYLELQGVNCDLWASKAVGLDWDSLLITRAIASPGFLGTQICVGGAEDFQDISVGEASFPTTQSDSVQQCKFKHPAQLELIIAKEKDEG